MAPRRTPYGGGNQFVLQLSRYLETQGYDVVFKLTKDLDCIFLLDGRKELTTFGTEEIEEYKRCVPSTVCVHRVNENDQRKGSSFMDDLLARTNRVADYTVFISPWLREYHAARWFDTNNPHEVVLNGADPRVFHPFDSATWDPSDPLRLVTHHWSDNPMKGFQVYEEIDRLITRGELSEVELWVIGRWPALAQWKSAQLFPPTRGPRLARLLRQCHAYVTASQYEPGGMHVVEGIQCGLPLLYHEDGGGITEYGKRFGIGFRDNLVGAILEMRQGYADLRYKALMEGPSGDEMCQRYVQVARRLVLQRKEQIG